MATELADVQLDTPGYGIASAPGSNDPDSAYDTKLSFYSPGSDSTTHDPPPYSEDATSGAIRTETRSSDGRAARYLQNKGFGWLMEVDEDDEESSQPLL